ncbi:hypothetical protein Tsubulata_044752 [Turnera subulata]|uniref:hAT-like transposase RNase-H fold domain-containing protein n=1 Tax=Turnera subulata TaxID=218843 RepID=A0A9Q0FHR6_9ROSI|nr:hypothetical protein Tsubulata_044752 [Turnera subulata]
MPTPHTGLALAEKITSFLVDWGIEKKVFTITLDNASNNDCSVDMLRDQLRRKGALICDGYFLHLRCCAHIVNLIVQEGLKHADNAAI